MEQLTSFFEYVPASAITPADWRLLQEANAAGPEFHRLPEGWLREQIVAGQLHLLRQHQPLSVVLVEVLLGVSGHKRLRIVRWAGSLSNTALRRWAEVLKHTAREWGCEQIESMFYSAKLAKAMRRVGAKAETIGMVMEVD